MSEGLFGGGWKRSEDVSDIIAYFGANSVDGLCQRLAVYQCTSLFDLFDASDVYSIHINACSFLLIQLTINNAYPIGRQSHSFSSL